MQDVTPEMHPFSLPQSVPCDMFIINKILSMMLKAQADPLPGELSEPLLKRLRSKIENIELLSAYVLE